MKEEKEITKVLQFTPKKNKTLALSDTDINNLFLGLVKLVKRSCQIEALNNASSELKLISNELLISDVKLNNAERKIEELENENKMLSQNLLELKTKFANFLNKKI